MLEDAGADYSQSAENLYGPTGRMDAFRGAAENVLKTDNTPYPIFFPPALWHRPKAAAAAAAEGDAPPEPVFINQVQACVVYLGEVLGYAPASPAERARADHISLNAQDYISAGRMSFHPVKGNMSYTQQREQGDKCSAEWVGPGGRGPVWLQFFEKILKRNASPTAPVAGGANVTYADFVLYHVLDATVAQFNNAKYKFFWDAQDVPCLKAFYAAFCQRPRLAAYRASDRKVPWGGDSMM